MSDQPKKLIPPLILIIVGGIAWGVDWLVPNWRLSIGGTETLTGLLTGAALTLMLAAAWSIIRHQTTINPMHPERTTYLVTQGPFRYTRNPIYLADALLLAAWLVWLGNMLSVLVLPLFVIYITRFQIQSEERALALKFGEDYRGYCRRVRRWV